MTDGGTVADRGTATDNGAVRDGGTAAAAGPELSVQTIDAPRRRRLLLPELLVGIAALLVFGWRFWVPSPWHDEMDTLAVARRDAHDIVALAGNLDVVHLAYYLLTKVLLLVWDSAGGLRVTSVLAMSVAAVLLVRIGRGLGDLAGGITAGLLLVASPLASRYAQEARPFALATCLATCATALLVTALDREQHGRPVRRWWVAYGVALVLVCLVNVLALLLLVGHGGFVLVRERMLLRRWLVALAAAPLVASPLLLISFGQRGQVTSWTTRPYLYDLSSLYIFAYSSKVIPVLIGLASAVVVVVALARHRGRVLAALDTLPPALVLGVSWAVLPPVTLWLASQLHSYWNLRYVVFCLPGLALWIATLPSALRHQVEPVTGRLAGAKLHRIGTAAVAAGLVVIAAVVGAPAQAQYRDPHTGHGEDTRSAVAYLNAHARAGDAVLFAPAKLRALETDFTGPAVGLADVAQDLNPIQAETIVGTEVSPDALPARLTGAQRVWVIRGTTAGPGVLTPTDAVKLALPQLGYTRTDHQSYVAVSVDLYTRTGSGPPS